MALVENESTGTMLAKILMQIVVIVAIFAGLIAVTRVMVPPYNVFERAITVAQNTEDFTVFGLP